MGVYITGMEMPKNCEECQCSYWTEGVHHDYCQAVGYDTEIHYGEKDRPQWCPLIEIPEPHGRLIDADALLEDMKRQCEEVFKIDAVSPDDFWITRDQAYNERLWKTWCESFYKYLESRPTVIPAIEEAE